MADIQQRTASVLPSVERIQQELARANSIDDRLRARMAFSPACLLIRWSRCWRPS